jgi:rubrerythrin
MRRALVVAAALVCIFTSYLHADEESDRKQYLDDITRLLEGIAGDLDRVPGDPGTGAIDYAVRKADEVKDKAQRLANVRGGDDRAARYASYYPGYVDKLKDAAGYLRQMKERQRDLDALPGLCADKERELTEKIRRYTDANNPDGVDAIPALGRELGKPLREAVEQADRRKSELEGWKDKVRNFSESDDKWAGVRSELHEAAEGIYDPWKRNWEQAKRTCNDLIKEDRNPAVEAALRLLADGEKVRQEIYRELDRQLDDAARAVDDLDRDSTEYDVETAVRATDALQAQLDKLTYAKGDDRKANEMVRNWPRYISALRETLNRLRSLKQGQFIVNKAPGACKDSQDRLSETIKRIVDARDHDSRDQIPLVARNLGKIIEEKLQAATQHDATMKSLRDAIKGFSISEAKWQALATNLKESAEAITTYWENAFAAAHKSCDELAKGEGHADVVRAMKLLDDSHSATENELGRIEADHRKWYEQIRELRGWYREDTKNVRDMFCMLEESPGDAADGGAYVAQLDQIVDRMRNRLAPKWNELMNESNRILQVLNELKRAPEAKVRSRAVVLYEKLDGTLKGLVNLMNDELKGTNDPEFRMTVETGKNEHKRIQADSSKCDASETTIPGARMRMDCVKVSSGVCTIVEIKPNNAKAIAKGDARAIQYRQSLREYFDANKSRIKDAFSGELEIFKRCIANETLELRTEVRAYDLCPPEGMMFRDFVVGD